MRITILPLILSLSLLVACGEKPSRTQTASPGAPVAVQVQTVSPVDWPSTYEATGTVRAKNVAVISSRVMAYARQVNFQAGDRVRAGQLLVELDSQDSDTQVRQAEAAHQEAREALQEVDGAIASAKANLELAQATFRRMEDLFQKKSISNQEYDEASARLKVARSAYEMAVARRQQVASKVSQAAEGMKAAAIMKDYARVTAPFDGVVTEKRVELGNLVTPGSPLAMVEREGTYRLEASVEESRLGEIRVGQSVSVALDRVLEARVSEIAPSVEAASRSYLVKIDLPSLPQLRSGMFGRAVFTLGKRSVLAVPAAAVSQQGQLRSVLVAEGGYARARLVTLGEARQDRPEVLSGLSAGEKIVFPVPAGLVDGSKVEVRP